MDSKMKYVNLGKGDVIIFSHVIEHKTFKHLNPITAGFCYVDGINYTVRCFGESFSLGIKSDPKQDTLDCTKNVFGVPAMIDLLNDVK